MSNPSIARRKATERMQATINYLEKHKQADSIISLYRSVPELRKYKTYVEANIFIRRMHKLGLIKFHKGYCNANLVTLNKSSELIDRLKKKLPFDGINKAVNIVIKAATQLKYEK